MASVGLIGYGGIAKDVVAALREAGERRDHCGSALPSGPDRTGACGASRNCNRRLSGELLARDPKVVAEVAGQQAVNEYGPEVLRRGFDFLVISIGALAEPALLGRLKIAAVEGKSRLLLPAGAIGGIDAIAAMRVGGLSTVRYRSRKPPAAWRGSPAEKVADLDKLTSRTVLYRGHAGEAALRYPQNANVAAAVALAGLGFENTEVELVADPDAPGNVHEIEAEGAAGKFAISLQGRPSKTNPKTSMLTALSVARALINLDAAVVI